MRKCLLEECETLTNNPKFCSLSHGTIHQNRSKVKFTEVKRCMNENCSVTFTVTSLNKDKKYCGHSCAAAVTNRKSPKRSNPDKVANCLNCESSLRGKTNLKYCSHACSNEHQNKMKIEAWLNGSWGRRGEHLSGVIRKYLLETSNYACSTCGFNTLHPDGSTVLQVDHINGDGYDHAPDNLRILCPNCHSLTPNFGGRNMGNGRAYRREARRRSSTS